MKLSEAIRLGSLLVDKPAKGDLRTCGMGMANLATNGYVAKDETDLSAWTSFAMTFPWTEWLDAECPKCQHKINSPQEIVWHPFDNHVCTGEMTVEQLADFIAAIEPQETTEEKREIVEQFCEQLIEQR